jgi:uncharacterized protein (TIGR02444 family)
MSGGRGGTFWDWSLDRYPRAKVALLALQDRRGFNINLLLWCVWRAEVGESLDETRLRAAIDAIEAWHGAITKPLRAARRRLAEFGEDGGQLKPRAQALELEAERIEHAILERLTAVASAAGLPDLRARAIHNLETYAALAGLGRNAGYSAEIAALAERLLATGKP